MSVVKKTQQTIKIVLLVILAEACFLLIGVTVFGVPLVLAVTYPWLITLGIILIALVFHFYEKRSIIEQKKNEEPIHTH